MKKPKKKTVDAATVRCVRAGRTQEAAAKSPRGSHANIARVNEPETRFSNTWLIRFNVYEKPGDK